MNKVEEVFQMMQEWGKKQPKDTVEDDNRTPFPKEINDILKSLSEEEWEQLDKMFE